MDRLRCGVIGVGWQGGGHLANLQADPRCELTAICDLNEALLAERAAAFGVPHTFTDFRQLIACEAVDAVIVVIPDHLHREPAMAVLEAGKHLLLEKPLAVTVDDAEAIAATARSAPGTFMLNLSNRFMHAFAAGKAALEAGQYGAVKYVWCRLANRLEVPTTRLPWLQHSHLAHWIGIHRLDIARWYIGSEVRRVRAVERRGVLAAQGFDTADFVQATLEFDNGAVVNLEANWILPAGWPSLVDSRFYCLCERGVIDVDRTRSELSMAGESFDLNTPGAGPVHGRAAGFTVEAHRHFVDCCFSGATPLVGAADGLALAKALCAVVESCRLDGEVIELS
ncbi:MAG: Gfo/Idh/MocA family oxidoreductase [Fimbriimonadaceae bacterium]|nr:Gfo/Idh/MocA family oxidoreductase [Fimbriimonadaceae bacterium]